MAEAIQLWVRTADGPLSVTADGGVTHSSDQGGGGGAGGAIRIVGRSITNLGTISAKGGTKSGAYSGGGGRVAFHYSHNLVRGAVKVGSGDREGVQQRQLRGDCLQPPEVSRRCQNPNGGEYHEGSTDHCGECRGFHARSRIAGTTAKYTRRDSNPQPSVPKTDALSS